MKAETRGQLFPQTASPNSWGPGSPPPHQDILPASLPSPVPEVLCERRLLILAHSQVSVDSPGKNSFPRPPTT